MKARPRSLLLGRASLGGLVAGGLFLALLALLVGADSAPARGPGPFLVVLGIAQDGGYPQAGTKESPAWGDPSLRRLAACLALVDPAAGRRWLFEATPDFREQLHRLDTIAPDPEIPGLDGIFLTHAHMGHYAGLLHLGPEAIGARRVPVYAMPRMERFLRANGPWELLVAKENVELRPLRAGERVELGSGLSVTPIPVPHRDEYSETVAFRVEGPRRKVLFLPDIDKWQRLDEAGGSIEAMIAGVDVAYLDGTFFADGEVPGRDMREIRHPFIQESLERFAALPLEERRKVRFIHLNRTNPIVKGDTGALARVEAAGMAVAREGERLEL